MSTLRSMLANSDVKLEERCMVSSLLSVNISAIALAASLKTLAEFYSSSF